MIFCTPHATLQQGKHTIQVVPFKTKIIEGKNLVPTDDV